MLTFVSGFLKTLSSTRKSLDVWREIKRKTFALRKGLTHIQDVMHELSVAQSVVDLACEHAARAQAERVVTIRLSLGLLSGVVKESLEFCFPVACEGTAAQGAHLEIDLNPAVARCPQCERRIELEDFVLVCPHCGFMPVQILEGGDLKVLSLDVE
jgi:hydrogenase nickel incorporation protein HypA/HybF